MLLNVLINRRSYTIRKYIAVATISAGITLFMFEEVRGRYVRGADHR